MDIIKKNIMEAKFSWRKILSFFGVAILVFIGIIAISSSIGIFVNEFSFSGLILAMFGICSVVGAVILYKNYNKWSSEHNDTKPTYTR